MDYNSRCRFAIECMRSIKAPADMQVIELEGLWLASEDNEGSLAPFFPLAAFFRSAHLAFAILRSFSRVASDIPPLLRRSRRGTTR
jgi:hypothetical protein